MLSNFQQTLIQFADLLNPEVVIHFVNQISTGRVSFTV